MTIILTFLIGLPLSVWFLATACAVIDEPQRTKPTVRLVTFVCVLLAVLLVTERQLIYPLLGAFGLVVGLHVLTFWFTSVFATGMPVYQQTPPTKPLLEESDDLEVPDIKG
jgi:hypothetical protein